MSVLSTYSNLPTPGISSAVTSWGFSNSSNNKSSNGMDWFSFIPIVGDLLGGLFGHSQQEAQNEANMELAKYQFDRGVEMWNMQNAYNTPRAQMGRLSEAGLNPNLVYGNGSVVGNTTSNAPEFKAPELQKYKPSFEGTTRSAMMMQQEKLIKAQAANLNTQSELNKYHGLEVLSKIDINKLDAESRKMYNEVYRYQMRALMNRPYLENNQILQSIAESQQRVINMLFEKDLTEARKDEVRKRIERISYEIDNVLPASVASMRAQATRDLSQAGLSDIMAENAWNEFSVFSLRLAQELESKGLSITGQELDNELKKLVNDWRERYGWTEGQYSDVLNWGLNFIDKVLKAIVDFL